MVYNFILLYVLAEIIEQGYQMVHFLIKPPILVSVLWQAMERKILISFMSS
jgi:hypothetical protein